MNRMKETVLQVDLLKESGIPRAFWKIGPDTYKGDAKALSKVDHYSNALARKAYTEGVGLYLYGPPETCKTFLLTYALRCLLAMGLNARYTTLEECIDHYFNNARWSEYKAQLLAADFLAIDAVEDTGKGGSDLVLDQIIRMRKDENLPILFASTMSPQELTNFRPSSVLFIEDYTMHIPTKLDPVIRDRARRKRMEAFRVD